MYDPLQPILVGPVYRVILSKRTYRSSPCVLLDLSLKYSKPVYYINSLNYLNGVSTHLLGQIRNERCFRGLLF